MNLEKVRNYTLVLKYLHNSLQQFSRSTYQKTNPVRCVSWQLIFNRREAKCILIIASVHLLFDLLIQPKSSKLQRPPSYISKCILCLMGIKQLHIRNTRTVGCWFSALLNYGDAAFDFTGDEWFGVDTYYMRVAMRSSRVCVCKLTVFKILYQNNASIDHFILYDFQMVKSDQNKCTHKNAKD